MGINFGVSKSYLEQEYIQQGRTANSIAKELGCCQSTVRNYLKKYDLNKEYSLVGQVFNRLAVEKEVDNENSGKRMWKCKCACGNNSILSTHELRSGNTKSCGCWNRVNRHNHKNWKGYKDISGKWWGGIRRGALARGHEFNITMEYVWDLFIAQDKKCSLSEVSIEFACTNRHKATASLDRIDNTKGYIFGNVQWVHKDVNLMKQKFDQDYFIKVCKRIAWKNK